MSYFNHSFHKTFLATKGTQTGTASRKKTDDGLLTASGVPTISLSDTASPNQLGVGTIGFFDPATNNSVIAADAIVTGGKPLYLAGSSLMSNDKIGPFHGGYKESNKSKLINPKYITKFYKSVSAVAEQNIVHLGTTNYNSNATTVTNLTAGTETYTDGVYTRVALTGGSGTGMLATVTVVGNAITSVVITHGGCNYDEADAGLEVSGLTPLAAGTATTVDIDTIEGNNACACDFEFLCGETYNLYINLNGSPVLRFLNHDAYATLAAYTGCCPAGAIAPVAVDSTLVMIDWAKQIINDPHLSNFIRPIVYTEADASPLFATAEEAVAAGYTASDIWDNYVAVTHVDGKTAGIRLIGAYVDTKFGNCSFEKSDFFEKDIVKMDVSLVDLSGDVCTFEGLCINVESQGYTGQGYGETVLREVIMHESYKQNDFADCDQRIREITQGDDILNSVDRNQMYTRYVIEHVVPRFNNPSGVFDNDRYCLEIYVPGVGVSNAALETFMAAWLPGAGSDVTLESFVHTPYTPVAI